MNSAQIGTNMTSIMVEKSEEFSYKELSIATNNFSIANKIGEGGFGEVFYAELRGQVCYILCLFYIYTYQYFMIHAGRNLIQYKIESNCLNSYCVSIYIGHEPHIES